MSEPCFRYLEEAQWDESPVLLLLKVCLPATFKDSGCSAIPAEEPGPVLGQMHRMHPLGMEGMVYLSWMSISGQVGGLAFTDGVDAFCA